MVLRVSLCSVSAYNIRWWGERGRELWR